MSKSSRANSARSRRKKNGHSTKRHIHTPPYPYTAATIRAGMARLPQELNDMIREYFFLPPAPDSVRVIDESTYKPPIQLQISHDTREDFKKKYYVPEARFVCVLPPEAKLLSLREGLFGMQKQAIRKLYASLDSEAQRMVLQSSTAWSGDVPDEWVRTRPGWSMLYWVVARRKGCGTAC